MSNAQETLDWIQKCKDSISTTLFNYASPEKGFLFSISDFIHYETCLREIVDDMFRHYIREANKQIEREGDE